jgi:hypothetical protein
LALEHFSKITYACPPHLWRLYEESLCSRWPGIELIAAIPSDLNGWDWYCPLMSLPLAFNTRLETIPANLPYLYADPKLAVQWREKLAALPNSEQPRAAMRTYKLTLSAALNPRKSPPCWPFPTYTGSACKKPRLHPNRPTRQPDNV